MAQEAVRRKGAVITVASYTPAAGDVAAGQVVLLGNLAGLTCGIADMAITNNVQGSLDCGGAVYEVINLDNAANGAKVWWSDSVNKVTTTSTNNALFGFVVDGGGGGANSVCNCLHFPYV